MIQRELNDTQPFSATTFPLFATVYIVSLVLLALILPILAIPKALPSAGHLLGNPSISVLMSWVHETGKPSQIRGIVAEQLGLPAGDLAVIERGFRTAGERFTHVCSIGAASPPALMFLASVDESSGDAKIWRVNMKGDVVASALFSNHVARRILAANSDDGFQSEMAYFLSKALASPPAPPRPFTLKLKSNLTDADPVSSSARHHQQPTDSSGSSRGSSAELSVLFSTPFVLPVIVSILAIAAASASKRRN